MFSRSAPYTPVHIVEMEELVEGERVHYNIPAELSDYVFRYWSEELFISSDYLTSAYYIIFWSLQEIPIPRFHSSCQVGARFSS